VVPGDTVYLDPISSTGSFASPDAGTGIAVTVSGLGLGGIDVPNYTPNQPIVLYADIAPASLTVTADSLYDGSRSNSRCRLSAKASLTGWPRCQEALAMPRTPCRYGSWEYTRPPCHRCAANAAGIRRFLLGWPAFCLPAGHSSVVVGRVAVVKHTTANTYSSPWLSRVPISGR